MLDVVKLNVPQFIRIRAAGPAQQPDSLAGDRDVHRFKQIVDLVV